VSEHPELETEQRRLDQAYGYLDQARRAAAAVLEQVQDIGSNQQALFERDVAVAHAQQRLAQLSFGDAQLCFGRLDHDDDRRLYIGRVAVTTPDQEPFVVDWRAPAAAPFYRATAVDPMGVVRRRHFHARGRTLVGIDDEVFDTEASERAGLHLVGEAALLAALARHRTGRMGDIVGTIQAEQDEAIRAPLPGILVVQGGPGTGKTAVALHRAAYLLYTHRQALAGTGVLVVGPNRLFLRYISNVLPSLGEEGVVLSTPWGLASTGGPGPSRPVRRDEDPRVAALKGDRRMADVLARALADRQRPLPRDLALRWRGHTLRLTVADSARIVRRVQRFRGSHNERRSAVAQRIVEHLLSQHREAAMREARLGRIGGAAADADAEDGGASVVSLADYRRARDPVPGSYREALQAMAAGEVPDWYREEFARDVLRTPEIREALFRMWPDLEPAELLHALLGFRRLLERAANGILSADEQALLHRPREQSWEEVEWTEADTVLLDELSGPIGPRSGAKLVLRSQRRRRVADRDGDDEPGPDEPREFGHVIVDEAQDLTPMQWRMLARRGPSGSFTLVGDFGQASRPGACRSWEEVADLLPQRRPGKTVHLSVNYRTPAEIVEAANRLLAVAAPHVAPTRAVRNTGEGPRLVPATDLVAATAGVVRELLAQDAGDEGNPPGTISIVAPTNVRAAVTAALADVGAVASSADALDAPVAVLAPDEVKGLEFDAVVVVEPAALVAEAGAGHAPDGDGDVAYQAGLRALFVALTRATRTLALVHREPLPAPLR
jgi:DNA helicase IV